MVAFDQAAKSFGDVVAVDAVSLDIRANEFFALLGPSGCGKTTLLRMLAGFEMPSGGRLLIDGEDMEGVSPNRRPVNMVFQSYAVFPHMTVADNVAYGLKVVGTPMAETQERVAQALSMVRLDGLGQRKPDQLSGGQRQRVALARALVKRPKVLLLDEPLAALDRKLREEMQFELVRLQHEVGITFIIVTHDQEEALSMADRIAVMDQGKLLQVAAPAALYERPNCRMVADFIGKMNFFRARVIGTEGGRLQAEADGLGELEIEGDGQGAGDAEIGVRPEKIELSASAPEDHRLALPCHITQRAFFGDKSHLYVETEQGHRLICQRPHQRRYQADSRFDIGSSHYLVIDPEDCLLLRS